LNLKDIRVFDYINGIKLLRKYTKPSGKDFKTIIAVFSRV
jgi:hypothetical protein